MFQLAMAQPLKSLNDTLMTRDCESLLHWREENLLISSTRHRFSL